MQMKKQRGRQATRKDKVSAEVTKEEQADPEASSKKAGSKPCQNTRAQAEGTTADKSVRKHIFSEGSANHNNSNSLKSLKPTSHPVTRSSALAKQGDESGSCAQT